MRILRGLGSQLLPCGCLVGRYETYDGATVALIDAVGARCPDRQHRLNHVVSEEEFARGRPSPVTSAAPE